MNFIPTTPQPGLEGLGKRTLFHGKINDNLFFGFISKANVPCVAIHSGFDKRSQVVLSLHTLAAIVELFEQAHKEQPFPQDMLAVV
jgi:hypothetical protein